MPSARENPQTGGIFASTGTEPAMNTITDEEINEYLKRGSSFEQGKFRIFSHFLQEHDTGERVRFLRGEYGTGGRNHAFPNVDHSYENHDSKGMRFTKGSLLEPSADTHLTWTNVAGRIDRLIKDGEYMTQNELDRLPSYERRILGAGVMRFYENVEFDFGTPPPIPMLRTGDFWGEAQRTGDLLDNSEIRSVLLTSMAAIMEQTPDTHRSYESRKEILTNLTAFDSGEFTLFPNYDVIAQPAQIEFVANEAETVDTSKIINAPVESDVVLDNANQRHTPSQNLQQISLFSLFASEESQKSAIQADEEAEQALYEAQLESITQEDIDNAIIAWNGDFASKRRVYEFVANDENALALDSAEFYMREFGGEPEGLTVTRVQRRNRYRAVG